MARVIVRIEGTKRSASYLSLVDTGSTFVVIPETDCMNLGLTSTSRLINLRTGSGVISAPLFIAPFMRVDGTDVAVENVEIVGKTVPGIPALLGMNFLRNFDFCFRRQLRLFTIE